MVDMPAPGTGVPQPAPDIETDELGDADTLVVEDHGFAIVGDWVIHAEISDAAFRVYSLLLRFGGTSGCRMPSRALLARRLHRSVDSIDRALRELVDHGIVRIEHRHAGRRTLSNRYHVRTTPPTAGTVDGRGRRSAAPRTDAAPPAADLRHDREVLTQTTPPPPAPTITQDAPRQRRQRRRPPPIDPRVLAECGIEDLDDLSRRCVAVRAAVDASTVRWSPACLSVAIRLAVQHRGWPATHVPRALLAIAADPATRSPGRLAEAGPWWDQPASPSSSGGEELRDLEQRLDAVAGRRPALQAQARAELAAEGLPLRRSTVVRRACEILDRQEPA